MLSHEPAAPRTPATREQIDAYEAQVKRDLCRDIGHRIADNGLLVWCLRCDYSERIAK